MTWMITHSGRRVDLLDPDPRSITIQDIAHHLARINRFSGGADWPVAAHGLLCLRLTEGFVMSPYHRLWVMLHDAHEAFTGDISRPMKELLGPERIEEIQTGLDKAIRKALGISHLHDKHAELIAKEIDEIALKVERSVFIAPSNDWPAVLVEPALESQLKVLAKRTPDEWAERFVWNYSNLLSAALAVGGQV